MIPVNEPLLGEKELEYVTECIRTGWISSAGKYIKEFESIDIHLLEDCCTLLMGRIS